jgi:UDP-N-acetylglucosamine enolpyruvyl transferase
MQVTGASGTWRIEPSGPLRGDIQVRGSTNAAAKHLVAAVPGDGPSLLHGVHRIERGHHRPSGQFTSLGLDLSGPAAG